MASALSAWFASLSAGALWLEVCLLGLTVMLVRSSLHPTTFALIAWPGVCAHEASHAALGFLLGAKPCDFSLTPKNLGDGRWQLGSVSFARMRWWNAPFTAMAPLLLAPLAVWLTAEWIPPYWDAGLFFEAAWRLGLCAILLQAAWPSSTDFKVAAPGLVVLGVLFWLLAL